MPAFIALLRKFAVAAVLVESDKHPVIADVTGDFVYARLQRTSEKEKTGYPPRALDAWAKRARTLADGGAPDDLATIARRPPDRSAARDVFIYMISGAKVRAPAAAMALIERLTESLSPAIAADACGGQSIAIGLGTPSMLEGSQDEALSMTEPLHTAFSRCGRAPAGFVEKTPLERYVPPAKPSLVGLVARATGGGARRHRRAARRSARCGRSRSGTGSTCAAPPVSMR